MYDFEEPFRWLVDMTVLKLIDSRAFTQDDFYFTAEDYRLRIKPPLLDRYAGLLRQQFNAGVVYGGDRLQWDTVILRKAQELARFLVGGTNRLELTAPRPNLYRVDSGAIRDKIRSLTSSEAKKLGIGKSTLHYLRKKARNDETFNVYGKVLQKLKTKSSINCSLLREVLQ